MVLYLINKCLAQRNRVFILFLHCQSSLMRYLGETYLHRQRLAVNIEHFWVLKWERLNVLTTQVRAHMRSIRQLLNRYVNSETYGALNIRHVLGFLLKGCIRPRWVLELEDNFGRVGDRRTATLRFVWGLCLISYPHFLNISGSNIQQDLLLGYLLCPHSIPVILVTKNIGS
jgi:hypothetical protein